MEEISLSDSLELTKMLVNSILYKELIFKFKEDSLLQL